MSNENLLVRLRVRKKAFNMWMAQVARFLATAYVGLRAQLSTLAPIIIVIFRPHLFYLFSLLKSHRSHFSPFLPIHHSLSSTHSRTLTTFNIITLLAFDLSAVSFVLAQKFMVGIIWAKYRKFEAKRNGRFRIFEGMKILTSSSTVKLVAISFSRRFLCDFEIGGRQI